MHCKTEGCHTVASIWNIGRFVLVGVLLCVSLILQSAPKNIGEQTKLRKQIEQKKTERSKLRGANPFVEYAEEDSVQMNIKKTTQRDQYHRDGCTIINRTFYCPIHRSSEKCIHNAFGGPIKWCKKGEFEYAKWTSLNRKVGINHATTKKIKALDAEIEELTEKYKALSDSARADEDAAEPENEEEGQKITLKLHEATLNRLLKGETVETDKYRLIPVKED